MGHMWECESEAVRRTLSDSRTSFLNVSEQEAGASERGRAREERRNVRLISGELSVIGASSLSLSCVCVCVDLTVASKFHYILAF